MATVRNLGLFPFCILDAENDPNSFFVQMEMSLDLGLLFWWRVKSWRVDSSELTIINNETGEETEIVMPTGQMTMDSPQQGITSEKELVCDLARQFGVGSGSSSPFIGLRIFPQSNRSGNLIKMHIDVRATIQSTILFFGNGSQQTPENGTCTINIQQQSVTFPIGGFLDGTGSLVISASEYWPYDPNDGGGPIYDSSTGVQLRPFP